MDCSTTAEGWVWHGLRWVWHVLRGPGFRQVHDICSHPASSWQGCKRKFDIDKYVARIGAMVRDVKAAAAAAAKQQ